jgi:aspartate/methionine/tyrosine aminotransferase
MGFVNALLAIADPGDEIILPAPYYFNHEMAVVMANASAVMVPTTASYQLDLDAIGGAITPKTRAVVTVSPNNPTGAVFPESDLRELNALCRDRGIFHIHDEAYEHFTYDGTRHFSPGSIDDAGDYTISLHSFSKGFGMASWRVGYMTVPEHLWDAVNKIQDTVLVCPPAISQRAALAAVKAGTGYAKPAISRLDQLRRTIYHALAAPGTPCDVPASAGAFYFFIRVHTRLDAMDVAQRLIREHRVATMPGSAFGATDGCYLRVSYGTLDDRSAAEGVARLVAGLRAIA